MKVQSLKFKMMTYSTVMVVAVVTLLATILFYYHSKQVWGEFDLRTTSLATALSTDLQLPVLLENKKEIERDIESVLKVQDVLSISVFNKNKELLVRSTNKPSVPFEYQDVVYSDIEIESDETIDELLEPTEGKGLEKIGRVEIIFSTLKLKNAQRDMIFIVVLFTIAIVILRIVSDYFFTARITVPIGELVKGSEAVADGDLTQIIRIERKDEIGKLASSFNTMVMSLKERDDKIMSHQQEMEESNVKLDVSLKEKELLLQEVHHRVKNNMQLISSMLKLQAKYIKDEKDVEIFKDCRDRIRSMALIHEKLYKSKDMAHIDFNLYIKDLAKELSRSYVVDTNMIALNVNVENVFLEIETAIPCGLIINELISNSLNYAFPEGRKGEIKTLLRFINKDDLELVVSDNGIGLPKDLDIKKTESLGLQLVDTLSKQLQGEMEINRTGGTEFKIKFKELIYKKRL